MDTYYSASDVARRTGTSIPRVQRAVTRLGMQGRRGASGRLRLNGSEVRRLERALGSVPTVPGLSRTTTITLAMLARSPRGVISQRALARRAALSPTAVGRALERLADIGLVVRERQTVALGSAREVDVLHANLTAAEWPRLAPLLARVRPPAGKPRAQAQRRVPVTLRHLFWNAASSQLDVQYHGGYIARRLLTSGDLEGIAWGAENLSREDWAHAAKTRGLSADRRALARNLLAGAQR